MRAASALLLAILATLMAAGPAVAADETTHARADAQRTGGVPDSPVRAPLRVRWEAATGTPRSNVLATGGRVIFVHGTKLSALDATSGAVLWSQDAPNGGTLAADGGRVFLLQPRLPEHPHEGAVMRAFDAASGAQQWQRELPGGYGPSGPPAAGSGQVFALVDPCCNKLYALRASDGGELWTKTMLPSGDSSPTLDATKVYISLAGHQTYAFDRATGEQKWHNHGCCTGGGGVDASLSGGRLYGAEYFVHDVGTGQQVGTWAAAAPPQFGRDGGFDSLGPGIQGFGPDYATKRWRLEPERYAFQGTRLIVGDEILTTGGPDDYNAPNLHALRLADGVQTWCGAVPRMGYAGPERFAAWPAAAGNGIVVVASVAGVVAYEPGGAASTCEGAAGGTERPSAPLPAPPPQQPALSFPPAATVAGPAIALKVGRTVLELGQRTNVTGRLSGLPNVAGLTVALELDDWPFDGRWRASARARTARAGTFAFRLEPRRNVRVRARLVRDPALASAPVDVFADFPTIARVSGRGGPRPVLRVTALAFPGAKLRRKTVFAYVARGDTTPWRLVARRRWSLTKRRATVRLPYPAGRLGKGDHWMICTREPVPDAFGRHRDLERRCGARTLPRTLS